MPESQCTELFAAAIEERVSANHKAACAQLDQADKNRIEVAVATGMQDLELQPEGVGRRLHVSRYGFGTSRLGRIDQHGDDGRRWNHSVQQLQPLRP